MSGIIGVSSITGGFAQPMATTDAQEIMNNAGTYTAAAGDSVSSLNFYALAGVGSQIEIGVYDASTGALLFSDTVTSTMSPATATLVVNQPLTAGVTYCVGWRCAVTGSGEYNVIYQGTNPCGTNTLTGTSPLANPFSSPYPPTTYDGKQFQIWATVTSASSTQHPVESNGKLLISNGHIVTSALLFMPLSWSINRRNKRAAERRKR